MKMLSEHVQVLRAAIQPLDTEERREMYRSQAFSDTRYRWELFFLGSRTYPPASLTTCCMHTWTTDISTRRYAP